jgi:hypothetical protein
LDLEGLKTLQANQSLSIFHSFKEPFVMEPVESPEKTVKRAKAARTRRRRLPSGRSVVLKVSGAREEIEVRSPEGAVEVCITLTGAGAVVSLRGGRLELHASDAVVVNSRRFEVNASEETALHSKGDLQITGHEMRVKTAGDIHMNGGVIHLNC